MKKSNSMRRLGTPMKATPKFMFIGRSMVISPPDLSGKNSSGARPEAPARLALAFRPASL